MNTVFEKIRNKLGNYSKLVMFSHTIFSLPFGLVAMLWAYGGVPPIKNVCTYFAGFGAC